MPLQIDKSFAPDKGGQPLNSVGDDYSQYIQEASAQTGLPAHLIQAVMMAESSGNPKANSPRGESYGAGLMGMSAAAAQDMGLTDVRDPRQNILKGAQYLKRQIDDFGGDVNLGLAAYNAGAGKVKAAGGVPEYTADYIQKITGKRPMTAASGGGGAGEATSADSISAMLNDPARKAAVEQFNKASDEAGQQLESASKQVREDLPFYGEMMKGVEADRQTIPTPPTLKNLPEPPDPNQYIKDPKRALGQFLPALAVLGSLMTRRSATTALRAAASAMSAQRRNDKEDLQNAHQKWMDDMDKALKSWEADRNQYLDIMENKKFSNEERMSELRIQALKNGDVWAAAQASQGRADLIYKKLQAGDQAWMPLMQMYQNAQKVDLDRQRVSAYTDRVKLYEKTQSGQVHMQEVQQQMLDAYDKDPANQKKSSEQKAEDKQQIIMRTDPKFFAQSLQNPKTYEAVRNGIMRRMMASGPGKAYESAKQYGNLGPDLLKKMNSGQPLNAQDQAALVEIQSRLLTSQAVRRFLIDLAIDHASLADKIRIAIKQFGTGGPLSENMQKNILQMIGMLKEDAEKNFAGEINNEMQSIYASTGGKADPKIAIPPEFDRPDLLHIPDTEAPPEAGQPLPPGNDDDSMAMAPL